VEVSGAGISMWWEGGPGHFYDPAESEHMFVSKKRKGVKVWEGRRMRAEETSRINRLALKEVQGGKVLTGGKNRNGV